MSEKAIITYRLSLPAFTFMGSATPVDESSDFGGIWDAFFKKGGYGPILPYAPDKSPMNIWFHDGQGRRVYLQGLIVEDPAAVPEGYILMDFPGGDYLAVTTEWMEKNEDAVGPGGNGRCNEYADTVRPPEGWVRADGRGSLIFRIERENADTPEGSRYEVMIPIERAP